MLEIEVFLLGVTTKFITELATCLPNLRKIETYYVSASQVKAILMHFKNLKELDIRVPKDPQETLQYINDYGSSLKRITLTGCRELSEKFIRENLKDHISICN